MEKYTIKDILFHHKLDKVVPDNLDIRHCHDKYEVLYVLNGSGRCVIEGSEFPIGNHTLIFVRPFEYHSLMLDKSVPYERCVLQFASSAVVPEVAQYLNTMFNGGVSCKYYPSKKITSTMFSLFERLDAIREVSEPERNLYMRMLLAELVLLLSASDGERISTDEAELGARVIRYLNSNIEKDISLDKLARRFFVSKYYLCRAFKKHNGISVHGYINRKRVMYAKQLIEEGETASGAAYRVGFGDYSAFYRAYVKIIGKSPTAKEESESRTDLECLE